MKARLLILGVLHRGNFHPYEIKRQLENELAERYIDVDVGTLYYAIRQLEREDMISVVSRERVARGGMRTRYRITTSGKAEFRCLLYQEFGGEGPVSQTLYGALLFLHFSDLAVIEDLLRRRIACLEELMAKTVPIRKDLGLMISTGGKHLLRHIEKQRELDCEWLKGLLADVSARRVCDALDPTRLRTGADRKVRERSCRASSGS